MQYDYSKLSGKISEVCKTQSEFAKRMGLSERSVSLKINGKTGWSQKEIASICEMFSIAVEDIHTYFFIPKVQFNLTKERN